MSDRRGRAPVSPFPRAFGVGVWAKAMIVATFLTLTSTVAPISSVSAQATCRASDLAAVAGVGLGPAFLGNIFLTNRSSGSCVLEGTPTVQIVDTQGSALALKQQNILSPAGRNPPPAGPVVLGPGQTANAFISWANVCQKPSATGPFTVRVTLPSGGTISMPLTLGPLGSSTSVTTVPPCHDPSGPATLAVTPLRAGNGRGPTSSTPTVLPKTGGIPVSSRLVALGAALFAISGVALRQRGRSASDDGAPES